MNISYHKYIIPLLLMLLGISTEYNAQTLNWGLPVVNNYAKDDYNAGPQNWIIEQDNRGIIYIGNNEGLIVFDGENWRKYYLPNKTIVRSIAIDVNGKIYVGGQGEFGYFFPDEQGDLSYQSLSQKIPKLYQSFEDVWKTTITSNGIFFCTFRAIFHLEGNEVKTYSPDEKFDKAYTLDGHIYVIDKGRGLLKFMDHGLVLVKGGQVFKDNTIAALLKKDSTDLMLITHGSEFITLKQDGQILVENYLPNISPYCAISLNDGTTVIGSSDDGMLFLNKKGKLIRHLSKGKGLNDRTILCLFQDNYGNLWAGLNNGIAHIEIQSPFTILNEQIGVQGSGYTSIINDNTLYVGTNIGVFYTQISSSEAFSPVNFKALNGDQGQTWTLEKKYDEIFIGKHIGAYTVDEQVQKDAQFNDITGAWTFIETIPPSNNLIEGNYKGLIVNTKEKNGRWRFDHFIEGFEESARKLILDDDGTIWVAHAYRGIYRVTLNKSMTSVIDVKLFNADNGLPTDINNNVFRINKQIIFTFSDGVYSYSKENDSFIKNTFWNKLFDTNTSIRQLSESKNGNIWFVTDDKVGYLEKSENFYQKKLIAFDKFQNRLIPGFEHIYEFENGNVLFGLDDGFLLYHPENASHSDKPYQALIRQMNVFGLSDSTIYRGYEQSDSNLESKRKHHVNIPYDFNAFRFSFSSTFYENSDKLLYSYYLEGFDNDWSDWERKTEKEYTNISEGTYAFHVKAKNIYGEESSEAVYRISVLAPWYRTSYAYLVYVLWILIMLYFINKGMNRKYIKEQELLKKRQKEVLQKKEDEFAQKSKISEEQIINLKNEKLEAEMAHKNKELATYTMQIMHNNQFLTKMKNRLLDVSQKITLKSNQKTINELINSIDKDIIKDVDWKQFEVHFDQSHENYLARLREKYPQLSPKDQKLCSYLRMNLTTKEIAPIMGISVRGVEIARYRLRKKLEIAKEVDLIEFIIGI